MNFVITQDLQTSSTGKFYNSSFDCYRVLGGLACVKACVAMITLITFVVRVMVATVT